jgi:hypothetical protein
VALLHVDFIGHAHNLFLQVAIEQGLVGLLALVGLLGWSAVTLLDAISIDAGPAGSRGETGLRLLYLAALASLVALMVHGMMDAGLYVGKGVPALFLPLGMALGVGMKPVAPDRGALRGYGVGCIGVIAIVAVVALVPATRAVWEANLGAVAQSRAELAVYHWPAWNMQDAVRRSPVVDLTPAIAHYEAALALDPDNATANRRLGQIELSREQYAPARQHLGRAYQSMPWQRATRQMLGESYAVEGNIAQAAELWRSIATAQGQLQVRAWWYEYLGKPELIQRISKAAQLAGGSAQ